MDAAFGENPGLSGADFFRSDGIGDRLIDGSGMVIAGYEAHEQRRSSLKSQRVERMIAYKHCGASSYS